VEKKTQIHFPHNIVLKNADVHKPENLLRQIKITTIYNSYLNINKKMHNVYHLLMFCIYKRMIRLYHTVSRNGQTKAKHGSHLGSQSIHLCTIKSSEMIITITVV